jgi:hypothetical protein
MCEIILIPHKTTRLPPFCQEKSYEKLNTIRLPRLDHSHLFEENHLVLPDAGEDFHPPTQETMYLAV